MPDAINVVYLFGAGATHAEIDHIADNPKKPLDLEKDGLLLADVTRRVMNRARGKQKFDEIKNFLQRRIDEDESSNIETFINLLDSNRYEFKNPESPISELRKYVEEDIEERLKRRKDFRLHKALFERHKQVSSEVITGLISLNYDSVVDEAFQKINRKTILDYSFGSQAQMNTKSPVPLLKLHGSFDWKNRVICGQKRDIPIIPVGANKNYLRAPYNFIWGRALEILSSCAKLRVVGCSLGPSDMPLADLLFKAHWERRNAKEMEIEVIGSSGTFTDIKQRFFFFPQVLHPDSLKSLPKGRNNYFKIWLQSEFKTINPSNPRLYPNWHSISSTSKRI